MTLSADEARVWLVQKKRCLLDIDVLDSRKIPLFSKGEYCGSNA
jgi:hypothetical protein